MASQPQSPFGGPPQDFGPPVGSGPISTAEVRILYLLVQIQHGLGRMEEAIGSLKAATNSHNEAIQRLTERTIRIESAIPALQTKVDHHDKDLNGLGAQHNTGLNELERRLITDLNQLGRRHDNEIKELEKVAHTMVSFAKFALALVAGGALAEFFRYIFHH